jgi:hypothetical protein
MNRLIKEEITRISELMKLPLITESKYLACQRFSDDSQKEELCLKIVSLKSWLHKYYGLNLDEIIQKKIEDLKSDIPEGLKQKFIKGAELLQSAGKISEEEKNNFIQDRVIGGKLVYLNGEWQPINKLNTNYYDLGELLTDLLYKGGDKSQVIIQKVIETPKQALTKLKPYIERLINKHFKDPNVFTGYTKNTIGTTKSGEDAENKVKAELEKKGFKEEYSGGNGDLIDMLFGTDLILSSPEHGIKTIQVKKNKFAWRPEDKYPYIDWVVIANPFTIYDNKTKEVVEL